MRFGKQLTLALVAAFLLTAHEARSQSVAVDIYVDRKLNNEFVAGQEGAEVLICDENLRLRPVFEFANYGWGPVENARITYSFGTESGPASPTFNADVGTFTDSQKVSVLAGLRSSGLDVNQATNGTFECPSREQILTCAQQLASTGLLGNLSNAVFPIANSLYSRVWGTISYTWTDSHGGANQRSTPFFVDIPILLFNTISGNECGAGGPVERIYPTVKLALDRANYRIPLSYAGTLRPQENRRLGSSLVTDKSSQHFFRVVLELADGTTVSSPLVDLLYFLPRSPYTS